MTEPPRIPERDLRAPRDGGRDRFQHLQASLLASLFRLVTPRARGRRLSVLMYHRVLEAPDELYREEIETAAFEWQMRLLRRYFTPLPLGEAVRRLKDRALPPRAVCVTFDDGYRDNQQVALPILERVGVPATFFVAAGYLDGGMMWNDVIKELVRRHTGSELDLRSFGLPRLQLGRTFQQRDAIERLTAAMKQKSFDERERIVAHMREQAGLASSELMMTERHIRDAVRRGVEIGAHTLSHPILTRLADEVAFHEIREGKRRLEAIAGVSVSLFAYPNGVPSEDYEQRHVQMVQDAGYAAALSTRWGTSDWRSDRWQLPRFTPWDRANPARFVFQMLRNYTKRT